MYAYRIETKTGVGAYRHAYRKTSDHSAADSDWNDNHCPSPKADGIQAYTNQHFCGFDSWAKLEQWFPLWRELLGCTTLRIRRYKLDARKYLERCHCKYRAVVRGRKQIMFARQLASDVEELDVATMTWHKVKK